MLVYRDNHKCELPSSSFFNSPSSLTTIDSYFRIYENQSCVFMTEGSSHPWYYRHHHLCLLNPHRFCALFPPSCPYCFLSSEFISTARRKKNIIDFSQNGLPPSLGLQLQFPSKCICAAISSAASGWYHYGHLVSFISLHDVLYLINNNTLPDDYCVCYDELVRRKW